MNDIQHIYDIEVHDLRPAIYTTTTTTTTTTVDFICLFC